MLGYVPFPAFHLFGPAHLGALAAIAALCVSAAYWGRRLPFERRISVGRMIAALLIGYTVLSYLRLGLLGALHWSHSLPLHLCDLTLVACFLALLSRRALAFELSYFWGLTGASQALLTPDLREGFPSPGCLLFFMGHTLVILTNVWLIAVLDGSPRQGSVLRAFMALNVYVAAVGGVDWLFGWNYGYLCRPPSRPGSPAARARSAPDGAPGQA